MAVCTKCDQDKADSEFYVQRKRGKDYQYKECKLCFRDRMNESTFAKKKYLVELLGGQCVRCGYDKTIRALVFHHPDPSQKEFGVGARWSSNLARLEVEVRKCILLCANCHIEEHSEII